MTLALAATAVHQAPAVARTSNRPERQQRHAMSPELERRLASASGTLDYSRPATVPILAHLSNNRSSHHPNSWWVTEARHTAGSDWIVTVLATGPDLRLS